MGRKDYGNKILIGYNIIIGVSAGFIRLRIPVGDRTRLSFGGNRSYAFRKGGAKLSFGRPLQRLRNQATWLSFGGGLSVNCFYIDEVFV